MIVFPSPDNKMPAHNAAGPYYFILTYKYLSQKHKIDKKKMKFGKGIFRVCRKVILNFCAILCTQCQDEREHGFV
jgi:hypothetical protein